MACARVTPCQELDASRQNGRARMNNMLERIIKMDRVVKASRRARRKSKKHFYCFKNKCEMHEWERAWNWQLLLSNSIWRRCSWSLPSFAPIPISKEGRHPPKYSHLRDSSGLYTTSFLTISITVSMAMSALCPTMSCGLFSLVLGKSGVPPLFQPREVPKLASKNDDVMIHEANLMPTSFPFNTACRNYQRQWEVCSPPLFLNSIVPAMYL
jgi:hypothetical protein